MRSAIDDLTSILSRYLSPVNAQSLLIRALREANIAEDHFVWTDVSGLLPKLERGIRLFLDPIQQQQLRADLQSFARDQAPSSPTNERVTIRTEDDISSARLRARTMCADLGARSLIVQKIVTIVSELARNIVSYTPGGSVELAVLERGISRALTIVAVDDGDGIHDLQSILEGRYKSRSGLGKGLSGVKRLADRFDVQTSPRGTRVEVEVRL